MRHRLTKVELKVEQSNEEMAFSFQKHLSEYAQILGDTEMMGRIATLDFGAREAWYHRICRTRYQEKAKDISRINEPK